MDKKIINEEVKFEEVNPKNRPVVSKTDIKGNILYANSIFAKLSGYTKEEMLGKPHNIVRHPDMPKRVFKEMWEQILSGKSWSGIVKNIRKDGRYYWVKAYIEPIIDKNNNIKGFISVRRGISEEEKIKYEQIYKEMREKEKNNS